MSHRIFIHGLEGTSQGVKASLLRQIYPDMVIPDFTGALSQRMDQLESRLGKQAGWRMVGSSLGGLMAALFAARSPAQVDQLVLLAPALILPAFAASPPEAIQIPTVIYHGSRDELIPLEYIRPLAEQVFQNLTFYAVDDDHGLYQTVHEIDWRALLG